MFCNNRLIVSLLCVFIIVPTLRAVTPPPDANWVDVTQHGALPDDGVDDTAALQALISARVGDKTNFATLYFPDGTYDLSDTLEWKDAFGAWKAYLRLQGQSRDGVILKLADNTFTDSANPEAVIFTASSNGGGPERPDGSGNTAFHNYIQDLTIDIGSENPGAVGIDYICNNVGAVRRVKIISSDPALIGRAGMLMDRSAPGPAWLEHVEIVGFDYALDFGDQQLYTTVGEDIIIRDQRVAGILSNRHSLTLHRLFSDNSVPALISSDTVGDAGAMTVLLDSVLSGGSSSAYAIEYNGGLLLRDVSIEGYQDPPLRDNNNSVDAGSLSIEEYVSHPAFSEFSSPARTLRLPVEEPPAEPDENVADWVKVNGRNAVAIQAALDQAAAAGTKTVYFPAGLYTIEDTLQISGSVERIIGNFAFLVWQPDENQTRAFDLSGLTGDRFILEEFIFADATSGGGFTWFRDNTTVPIFIRDLNTNSDGVVYEHTQPKKIFIENCSFGDVTFTGAQVWGRQFNPEDNGNTKVINDGSDLWVLGFKTEWASTSLDARNGARSEIFGTMFYPPFNTNNPDQGYPAVINNESQLTLVGTSTGDANTVQVRDTRGGVTRDFLRSEILPALELRNSNTIPLYVNWEATIPLTPSGLQASSVGSHSVTLQWTDEATNEDGYIIERRQSGGSWQVLANNLAADSTSYVDVALAALQDYEYRVKAQISGITSTASNVLIVSTTASTSAPSAASNLQVSLNASDGADLTWTDGASNENAFRLERRSNNGSWQTLMTLPLNSVSTTDTSLVEQVAYDYRVVAYNDFGEAFPSNIASVQLPVKAPGNLAAHAEGSGVLLTWTDFSTAEAGYQLERQGGGSGWTAIAMTAANKTDWLDTGVADGTAYDYRVAAVAADASLSAYVNTSNARKMSTFAEEFAGWEGDGFDLDFSQLILRQRGPGVYDAFLSQGVTEFPVDYSGHPEVALDDRVDSWGKPYARWNNYEIVTLTGGKSFPFHGQNHTELWLGSRGVIGLGEEMFTTFGDLADIDERLGLAYLGNQLTPPDPDFHQAPHQQGNIYGQQMSEAYVLTVVDVPTFNSPFPNNVQVELFFNGDIRITWLEMNGNAAIIGLSDGVTPLAGAGFVENDISTYPEEPVLPPLHTLTVEASHGVVSRVPDLNQYFEGAVVTLTALPDTGYGFGGWSGALNTRANGASLQITEDASIKAWFFQDAPPPYHHDFDSFTTGDVVGQSTNGLAWANLWGDTSQMDIVSYDGGQALALLGDGLVWHPQSDEQRGFPFNPSSSEVTFSFKIARNASGAEGSDPRIFFGNANHQILGFAFWGRGDGVAAYVHGGGTAGNAVIHSSNLVDSRGISMPTGSTEYFEVSVDVDFASDEVTAIRYNGLNILSSPVPFVVTSQEIGIYVIGTNSSSMVPYMADIMLTSPDAEDGYPSWSASINSGPLGDENGDGVPNLFAYAVGGQPGSLPKGSLPGITTGGLVTVPYSDRRDGSYRLEMSTDLSLWEVAATKAAYGEWQIDPASSQADEMILTPSGSGAFLQYNGTADKSFFRLGFEP